MSVLDTEIFSAAMFISRAIVITDNLQPGNPIIFVNNEFTIVTGYSSLEAVGQRCRFLQGPATDEKTINAIRDAMVDGRSIRCEILNYRKDGTLFWNDLTIDPIHDAAGATTRFVGVLSDSSRINTVARDGTEDWLRAILDRVPGYIYHFIMHPSGEVSYLYMSPSIRRILGLPVDTNEDPEHVLGRIHREDRYKLDEQIAESARNLTPFKAEFRLISVSGQEHWFRSEASPQKKATGDIIWDGIAIEITAEKLWEAKVEHLAHHDPLTGLSNRLSFNKVLTQTISSISPGETQTGIFVIDLDGFQTVNETFGGITGDKVLRRIGLRLIEFAEPLGGTAARLGGDEFVILLPKLAPIVSVPELAEAICVEIRRPMVIDGGQTVVEASVGVAVFPPLSDSSQTAAAEEWGAELLNRASLALNVAKRDGPGVCRLYSTDFDDRHRLRPELRKSLGRAISQEQFTLNYQPIINLTSGEVVGAEALLRWEHPEFGLQRPDLFIPIAESSGLIVPLGSWVIKAAMRQAEAWKQEGLTPGRIAINVSSIQLQRPGFLAMIQEALNETGADARQFEFELTEGILLHESGGIKTQFETLREMGFGLVIDDFGTGHATFGYLRSYAVDKLKIDQLFVRHLVVDSSDAAIIRSIIALCRSLNLKVVAEGIETMEQRDFLIEEGCTFGQGYLFSLPLCAEDFGWILKDGLTLPIKPSLS